MATIYASPKPEAPVIFDFFYVISHILQVTQSYTFFLVNAPNLSPPPYTHCYFPWSASIIWSSWQTLLALAPLKHSTNYFSKLELVLCGFFAWKSLIHYPLFKKINKFRLYSMALISIPNGLPNLTILTLSPHSPQHSPYSYGSSSPKESRYRMKWEKRKWFDSRTINILISVEKIEVS